MFLGGGGLHLQIPLFELMRREDSVFLVTVCWKTQLLFHDMLYWRGRTIGLSPGMLQMEYGCNDEKGNAISALLLSVKLS